MEKYGENILAILLLVQSTVHNAIAREQRVAYGKTNITTIRKKLFVCLAKVNKTKCL